MAASQSPLTLLVTAPNNGAAFTLDTAVGPQLCATNRALDVLENLPAVVQDAVFQVAGEVRHSVQLGTSLAV